MCTIFFLFFVHNSFFSGVNAHTNKYISTMDEAAATAAADRKREYKNCSMCLMLPARYVRI